MGCSEREWLSWLPGAVDGAAWQLGPSEASVRVGEGMLRLAWHALPQRRIALIALPRLAVRFEFDAAVGEEARQRFMRRFDLYMQRGGG